MIELNISPDDYSLALENLIRSIIVIPPIFIIIDISIIDIISHCILIFRFVWSSSRVVAFVLEIISQVGVVTVLDGFELSVGVETENSAEEVVYKTYD